MKKLVVFYSLTGNTKFIAETIAKTIKADLLEVKPKKDIKKKGVMRYLWGGRQVIMKSKPELHNLDKDPEKYDIIFIGTPVWSFSFAPAIRSFFSKVDLKKKKIALFDSHEGGPGKTLSNMKSELSGNEIIGKGEFFIPLTGKIGERSTKKEIVEWAKKVMKNA